MDEVTFNCQIATPPSRLRSISRSSVNRDFILTPNELQYFPKPYDYPYQVANLIRRLMYSRVQTLALDTVEIQVNDSSLHDEILAQRLGQIPITYPDLDELVEATECSCAHGCPACSREVELNVTATRWMEPVMTDQLTSKDPKIQPMTGIILAYLPRGGRIRLLGTIRKSSGSYHAKWSPVTNVLYTPQSPEINNSNFTFQVELVGSLSIDQLMTSICQHLQVIFPSAMIIRE